MDDRSTLSGVSGNATGLTRFATSTEGVGRASPTELIRVLHRRYWERRREELKHPEFDLSHWKRRVDPYIGHMSIHDVTRRHIAAVHDEWRAAGLRGGMAGPHRVLSHFFIWAEDQGYIDVAPLPSKKPYRPTRRDRVLSITELRTLYAQNGHPRWDVLKWLLLTGMRKQEVQGLEWGEVATDRVSLPPERTKNRRRYVCPIIPDLPMPTRSGEKVFGINPQWNGKDGWCRRLLPEHWCLHDIRRSLATHWAEELRVSDDLIERHLGHSRQGVAGVYNHAQRVEERREAMGRWVELLRGGAH